MSAKKKASDVLIELQEQVAVLTKMCQDIDSNVKHIRKELNLQKKVTKQEQVHFPPAQIQDKPAVSVPTETNKHSTIEQSLVYKSTQRPIALADIKIYDIDTGSMIEKKLSGPNGKWNALLRPGKFRVEIKKGPTAGNNAFIEKFELEIKGDGAPIILGRKLI